MTGPTGSLLQLGRPDDIESSARPSGATPTGVKGHSWPPARLVTLRVSVVGSSLASPSGLRVLVHPTGAP